MSFFLVFLAIVLVGAVVWAGAGGPSSIFRRGRPGAVRESRLLDAGFEQPVANLPPVLLPADAAPADVDRVRFSLGLRGYRMDQVDQVLDELRDQLAAKRGEVEQLTARLVEAQRVIQKPADTDLEPQQAAEPTPQQGPEQAPPGPGRSPAEDGA
ncbi:MULTISPECIES: DivIVA domain-containing protein [unclassified Pseudarthrobacter]|uniref:DivIVA domain-containing protein n=1 Tax=unclassified Pseudarthrobacter TaxID=2647000 RepID=UPI003077DFE4